MALILAVSSTHGVSLLGDHSCVSWQSLDVRDKRAWANSFLAPLSLTLKGLFKSQEDRYNDDPKAHEAAIQSIDAFCTQHPDLHAPDAAGLYLKKLYDRSLDR